MRITPNHACHLLKSGSVVAIPTETVYGLAACLDQTQAIEELFSLKGRPSNNPLIIHLFSLDQIQAYASMVPAEFFKLAQAFWPGPLTIVLPIIQDTIPHIARAGLSTAGFRVPSHKLARDLILETGPLVMPSANLSGKPSSTSAAHVEMDFGSDFPVLDGGECLKGLESTILFWQNGAWEIIRLGSINPEAFMPVLGYIPKISLNEKDQQGAPLCPGQFYRHYAPKAKLFLVERFSPSIKGVIIGFEDRKYPPECRLFALGTSNNPQVASQRLYAVLRELDKHAIQFAWVDINLPNEGLWLTLKERLYKAAK